MGRRQETDRLPQGQTDGGILKTGRFQNLVEPITLNHPRPIVLSAIFRTLSSGFPSALKASDTDPSFMNASLEEIFYSASGAS